MHASVLTASVPASATAELVDHVSPLVEDGEVVDWRVRATSVMRTDAAEVLATFAAWRSEFVTDFALGERGFILAVVGQVPTQESGYDGDAGLRILRRRASLIETSQVESLARDLERRRGHIRGRPGWALFASPEAGPTASSTSLTARSAAAHQPERLVRRLVPTEPATALLATPTAGVGVDHTGLRLLLRRQSVLGWRGAGEQMLIDTPHGEHAIRAVSLSASLLRRLGRQCPRAVLRAIPLDSLAAPVLDELSAATRLATDTRKPLRIYTRPDSANRWRLSPATS